MIMKLIKYLVYNYPFLNSTAAFLYNFWFCFPQMFQRNIVNKGAYLKKCSFHTDNSSTIYLGKGCRLRWCNFYITGKNCKIIFRGGMTIVSKTSFCCVDDNSTIIIGKDFTMEGGEIASTEGNSITIGDDCMFSAGIDIRNGDSHKIFNKENGERVNHGNNINIGNHVWLARKVSVLKGAKIADGSIVGNSSVITGECMEENSVYAGIPAKYKKSGVIWQR